MINIFIELDKALVQESLNRVYLVYTHIHGTHPYTSLYKGNIKLDIIIIIFNVFSYKYYIQKHTASIWYKGRCHLINNKNNIIKDTLNTEDDIPLRMPSFVVSLPYTTIQKITEVSTVERIKKRQAAALLISMGYSHNHLDADEDSIKNSFGERGHSLVVSLSVPEPIYNMVFDLVDLHHLPRSTVVAHMIEAGYEAWKHEKEEVKK